MFFIVDYFLKTRLASQEIVNSYPWIVFQFPVYNFICNFQGDKARQGLLDDIL